MKKYKLIYDVLHPHKLDESKNGSYELNYNILQDKIIYYKGLMVQEYFYVIDVLAFKGMIFAHCLYRNVLGEMTATLLCFEPNEIEYYEGHIAEVEDEFAEPVKYIETEITIHSYESL